ncbi:MAG: DUF2141 domain-containing protein [Bacteroidales bacterium]|jgi:uncharacterized protein (DUF2141 family)|nr:DUF2141 domain-containing protein [Bacteroidales bacterium]
MKATVILYLLMVFALFWSSQTVNSQIVNSQAAHSQTMNITVKNIRSTNGKLSISVFASSEEFKANRPSYTQVFDKTDMKDKTCTVRMEYKPGIYGLSVYDDENGNNKMDYNFIGMPKEGFGMSNYNIKLLSRPAFSDFNFQLKTGENKYITVELTYL